MTTVPSDRNRVGMILDIFRTHPDLIKPFNWNEATREINKDKKPLGEDDIFNLRITLMDAHNIDCNDKIVTEALKAIALKSPYNPIKQYLESLQWDGIERLDKWGKQRLLSIINEVYKGAAVKLPKLDDHNWAEAYYVYRKELNGE